MNQTELTLKNGGSQGLRRSKEYVELRGVVKCGQPIIKAKKYLKLFNCKIENNNLTDLLLTKLEITPKSLEYLEIKRADAGRLIFMTMY